ncbi:MAG: esterase-like activity of phytase family protein [Steroidobacteraceae bacterium]
MIRSLLGRRLITVALAAAPVLSAHADIQLIATANLPATYEDLNNQTAAPLENSVAGNRVGGLGSSIAYAGGDNFLMLPDRGPNAVEFASSIDNTVSYINRFHTFNLRLLPKTPSDALAENNGSNPKPSPDNLAAPFDVAGLPFILTQTIRSTTLLWSPTPLVYGKGGVFKDDSGNSIGSGAPALNAVNHRNYFTGRSDNFDPTKLSNNPNNARLDPESIKVSNDGRSVFISDEYGPYVYQFDRGSGARIRSFKLPDSFAVANLGTTTASEAGANGDGTTGSGNTVTVQNTQGRVANKGAEGLAITPDGRTLAVALQSSLIQDGGTGTLGRFTRIVIIDIPSGRVTGQYAYPLCDTKVFTVGQTQGCGATISTKPKFAAISEILAVNNHQFLVDERDGKGFEGGGSALYKVLNLVDITAPGVQDVSSNTSFLKQDPSSVALQKTPFLDLVQVTKGLLDPSIDIPAKLEGITFGQDVKVNGQLKHTLYLSSDNDFLASFETDPDNATKPNTVLDNPSKIFVFAFDPTDLPTYIPQPLWTENFPDPYSPEDFPTFLYGPPAFFGGPGPWEFGH